MPLTTQDFLAGIDIDALETVSASQLSQLIEVGRTAEDKGLNIKTTDTALDLPDVPNPDLEVGGITPTWWKRYLWIREPFDDSGIVKTYAWNDQIVSDATYLKWEQTNPDVSSLATQAALDAVEVKADQALADAAAAQSDAGTALSVATSALDQASGALSNIPGEVSLQLEEASAGLEAGKIQITFANLLEFPDTTYSKYKHLFTPVLLHNDYVAAGPIALTAWTNLDLTAHKATLGLSTYSDAYLFAVLRVQVKAGFFGAGANDGLLKAYFAHGNAVAVGDARKVEADIIRTSPNDVRVSEQSLLIVRMSAIGGVYWRWESTANENYINVWLEGIIAGGAFA